MLWRYTTSSGLTMFTHLVGLTVVFVAIPYLFSACAQLTYLVSRCRPLQRWLLAQDLSISVAAGLFSLWVAFAGEYSAVNQAGQAQNPGQCPAPAKPAGERTCRDSGGIQLPAARERRTRRLAAPVLAKIDLRWSCTVCSDRNIRRAISRVSQPPAR
jgi:hypothetical protein